MTLPIWSLEDVKLIEFLHIRVAWKLLGNYEMATGIDSVSSDKRSSNETIGEMWSWKQLLGG
jgi:hypothetical protein